MIEFCIGCTPTAWAAPKIVRRVNGQFAFDIRAAHKDRITKELIAQYANLSEKDKTFLRTRKYYIVDFMFGMPYPKSWSKKKREANYWHVKKPDRTNLMKLYEDCLERANIIPNDSRVVAGKAFKYYHDMPHVIICIKTDLDTACIRDLIGGYQNGQGEESS